MKIKQGTVVLYVGESCRGGSHDFKQSIGRTMTDARVLKGSQDKTEYVWVQFPGFAFNAKPNELISLFYMSDGEYLSLNDEDQPINLWEYCKDRILHTLLAALIVHNKNGINPINQD